MNDKDIVRKLMWMLPHEKDTYNNRDIWYHNDDCHYQSDDIEKQQIQHHPKCIQFMLAWIKEVLPFEYEVCRVDDD